MKRKLNLKQIQLEEKNILDKLVDFLEKNNINYFLYAGTLLGAIRHKGFIPWDDDIDIAILRPDYDRLQNIIKNNSNALGNNLFFHSYELGNLNMPFTKVYNYDIEVFDSRYKDKYEKYLWIDIFPIDGMPQDDEKTEKLFCKRNFWRRNIMYKKMNLKYLFHDEKNILKLLVKIMIKVTFNILPENAIAKRILSLNETSYEDSSYAGCFVWGYGPQEKMKKNVYEIYNKVEFEGSTYNGLENYDEYLSKIYGDYMKLPKEENRITHNFEAWYNEK